MRVRLNAARFATSRFKLASCRRPATATMATATTAKTTTTTTTTTATTAAAAVAQGQISAAITHTQKHERARSCSDERRCRRPISIRACARALVANFEQSRRCLFCSSSENGRHRTEQTLERGASGNYESGATMKAIESCKNLRMAPIEQKTKTRSYEHNQDSN